MTPTKQDSFVESEHSLRSRSDSLGIAYRTAIFMNLARMLAEQAKFDARPIRFEGQETAGSAIALIVPAVQQTGIPFQESKESH